MRVVVIGMGPWPLEPGAIVTGPAIRLRQFVQPLLAARHEVVPILLEDDRRGNIPVEGTAGARAFGPEEIADPELLRREISMDLVGAVFGVGSLLPAAAAARLATALDVPCWIDLFGDPLAELHAAQLRQGGTPDTMARDHVWKLMREVLLRGDSFSTVSTPQRHALLGQVGLLGRYGIDWDVCGRIHEIPCAVPDQWAHDAGRPGFPAVLRQHGLDETTRYVFFGGSWNVWLDEATMGQALAIAMDQDPSLRFVCCGIPTGPAGEAIRQSLLRELQPHAQRGQMIELPPQELAAESQLLAWAGATISLDRPIPEAEFGSRNRLLAMVRHGARPVVSVEAGIEAELVAEGLAAGILQADPQRTAEEILTACARTAEDRERDRRTGIEWLRRVTFQATLEPVRRWLARMAPRWPVPPNDGLLDRWARLSATPESLFPPPTRKRWFQR